jgi:carbon storage regulator
MIGHDIVVTVLSISRDHVRIGIQAPAHVEVHRQEVYLAIQEANQQAAAAAGGSLDALNAVIAGRRAKGGDAPAPAQPAQAPAEEGDGASGTATP